jgi:hypothetical protein
MLKNLPQDKFLSTGFFFCVLVLQAVGHPPLFLPFSMFYLCTKKMVIINWSVSATMRTFATCCPRKRNSQQQFI